MLHLLLSRTLLGAPILLGFFVFSYGVVLLAVKCGLSLKKPAAPPPPAPKPRPPKPEKVYYLIENEPRPRTPKLHARRVYFSQQPPEINRLDE